MIHQFLVIFFLLLFGHFLADYPLQGDFLAKGKNRNTPFPGMPWQQILFAHSMIHAGFVFLVTRSLTLAFLELIVHAVTDDAKCRGRISFTTDQAIHVACKLVWALIALSAWKA